jgi:hypothetical protein
MISGIPMIILIHFINSIFFIPAIQFFVEIL